jgi:hypothetical protein
MKFLILVSNLKEISPTFSPEKKRYIKKNTMQFCQNTIQSKKDIYKLCLRVEKWSRSVNIFFHSSYQCPVNFGKDSRLIIRCVNGDFTYKHSNSFH